ncbi:MAG: AzlD domain-containing protein [Levilactobacillus sp.]|jgi:branched-subunit amino acid transport protein|uniref:AzlD domain-containing protein n=1 Tax=Levilactobacillus suantsaiihabitans TaxID=2487722 RepID=A0A4Z0J933_9LACO|nr:MULTISPECIES: AzlD domain-containing protein [Levilactobacillus]MCI1553045.1 AzlD domain-containing protein [Levilactobacillus sp.]MCI1598186.1 AzlD domain-containing protein [Levilactobacillus sp.]MCI1605049.1 AzlD domain-containing protein [Levilactobacillus sp.]TGD18000.1 AzlD domain-containing protein [Levilactobacillus suantsaiihabitans]
MSAVNTWNSTQHFWLIILGFCVAFVPRYLPLMLFTKRAIPEWFNEWMKFVPVSLFTALVVKDIFIDSATYQIIFTHFSEMIAAVIVVVIAYRTRSMAISVITGLIAVFLLSMFIA